MLILFLTYKGYPHGGAEEFIHDRQEILEKAGFETMWVFFDKMYNGRKAPKRQNMFGYFDRKVFSPSFVSGVIRRINPDVVWTLGHGRTMIAQCCHEVGVPVIAGIHYWREVLLLHPSHKNVSIKQHLKHHRIDPDFYKLKDVATILYTPSIFVREIIEAKTGHIIPRVHYSCVSSRRIIPNFQYDPEKDGTDWILMMNTHYIKGGEVIEHLLKYPDVKFRGFMTEGNKHPLDKKLLALQKRFPDRIFISTHTEGITEELRKARIVIVPSRVDETFSRATIEAMSNGIPVLGSRQGNLSILLDGLSPQIDPFNPESAASKIMSVYRNPKTLREISKKCIKRSRYYHSDICKEILAGMVEDVIDKKSTVLFIVPWSLQGLGVQTRNYVSLLESRGIATSILSFKPLSETRESKRCVIQDDPIEWAHPRIYWSTNGRRWLTSKEIETCIDEFNAHTVVVAEPTGSFFLQTVLGVKRKFPHLRWIGIPNLETMNRSELSLVKDIFECYTNNHIGSTILRRFGISSEFLGYSVPSSSIQEKKVLPEGHTIFFLMGGNNAFKRRNLLPVLRVMKHLHMNKNYYERFSAILTLQHDGSTCDFEGRNCMEEFEGEEWLTVLKGHLTSEVIEDCYATAHVTVVTSMCEGLGIPIYESLSKGCPVIAVDTAPHNELVTHEVNGWLVKGRMTPYPPKPESMLQACMLEEASLSRLLENLILMGDARWAYIFRQTVIDWKRRFSYDQFGERLAKMITN